MSDLQATTEFVVVPGYPDYRTRASDGRVQSKRRGRWRDLGGWVNVLGYRMFAMRDALGVAGSLPNHVIVARTFLGPCPEGHEVCHADDVKLNCSLANLRYGTRQDNLADAIRNGRKPVGAQCSHAKLTPDAVAEIRRDGHKWGAQTRIAREYGVSLSAVNAILKGRTWKHDGARQSESIPDAGSRDAGDVPASETDRAMGTDCQDIPDAGYLPFFY
jgi:hypothetical protein